MSRILRRQLFSIAELLEKANKILEKKLFVPSIDEQSIIELVTDCQDSAISMGEQIEKMYGEGTASVGILEQYCENLYLLTISLQDVIKRRELYNTLNKQLKKLRSVMNSELPDKLEVVFFPYKVCMWDSLESVYLAAKEDENCDAYCVPIPYFDRNRDGSLGQMHYEGNEYPKKIEIIDWEKYNFEERKPDAVFIHNPYDDWNTVTCVHPRYFSSNLKKYTDELVYIPYFMVDDTRSIDKIEHYAFTPAVINSDLIIVQSEKVRQKYIDVLLPYYKDTTEALKWLENRIIGLGSPKIDAVMREKPPIDSLPEEWQKIIGDKSKKIIFYNTHLNLLMYPSYKIFLIKLKQVLDYFKTRDDMVLLWRPHPLAISTAKSMNPDAVEPYMQIVEKYRAEKWGIYDDTPDMDRSIALADAYYGSESSVVPVFRKTGKPVLIHNPYIVLERI